MTKSAEDRYVEYRNAGMSQDAAYALVGLLRRGDTMSEPRQGDIAVVEGRVAVYMPTRWEWLDGSWTAIPSSVGPVLGNAYDVADAELGARLRRAIERLEECDDPSLGLIERARLGGKVEGVKLALSYLEEEARTPGSEL